MSNNYKFGHLNRPHFVTLTVGNKCFLTSPALLILVQLFMLVSCASVDKYSKKNHLFTGVISDQLFSEVYRVESFGVGGDVYSVYLTDSLSFRKFIDLYYDNESFDFIVLEDHIEAVKKEESGGLSNPKFEKTVIKRYRFSINELVSAGDFN